VSVASRQNGGGSPDGVVFWCSYLDGPGTHFNDIFEAETGETRQFWSTGTNWEGTGVVPDISVAAEDAYDVAYGTALRHVLSLNTPPPIHPDATATLDRLNA